MLCVLSSIAFATGFFYSLAASFFQIIPVSLPGTILVDISGNVGLGYNLSAYPYAPFVIAAGVSACLASMFGFVNNSSPMQGLDEACQWH